jgi:deoxyhypusine synthase
MVVSTSTFWHVFTDVSWMMDIAANTNSTGILIVGGSIAKHESFMLKETKRLIINVNHKSIPHITQAQP